jgi:hypothetical protein
MFTHAQIRQSIRRALRCERTRLRRVLEAIGDNTALASSSELPMCETWKNESCCICSDSAEYIAGVTWVGCPPPPRPPTLISICHICETAIHLQWGGHRTFETPLGERIIADWFELKHGPCSTNDISASQLHE